LKIIGCAFFRITPVCPAEANIGPSLPAILYHLHVFDLKILEDNEPLPLETHEKQASFSSYINCLLLYVTALCETKISDPGINLIVNLPWRR